MLPLQTTLGEKVYFLSYDTYLSPKMDQQSIQNNGDESVQGKDSSSSNIESTNQMGEYIKMITQKSIEKELAVLQQQMASDREDLNRQFEQKLDSKLAAILIALKRLEVPSSVPASLIDRDEHRDTPPIEVANPPQSSLADTQKT